MKRWFYDEPSFAISNWATIRAAAIAAGVTLVSSKLRIQGETEAAGKVAAVIKPGYVAGDHIGYNNPTDYHQIDLIRAQIHSKLVSDNQARIKAGEAPQPIPSTERLQEMAQTYFDQLIEAAQEEATTPADPEGG